MSAGDDSRQSAPNDVASEVTLVSQDKQEFKVKKYHLLSASSFFRDMLEAPGLSTGTAIDITEPGKIVLELDVPGKTLQILIDLINKAETDPAATTSEYLSVLDACDEWGIPAVVDRVLLRLRKLVDKAPWAIFCAAARLDDVELAKYALANMDHDTDLRCMPVTTLPATAIAQVTLSYYAGLVKASTGTHCCRVGSAIIKVVTDWTVISQKFEPVRF